MSDRPPAPKVSDYMHADIVAISVDATLQEASQMMDEKKVGALLVKEGEEYVGIISEKRLTRDGMAKGFNAQTTTVRTIMRKNMVSIDAGQSVTEARETMKAQSVRHLVVMAGGRVVGIITLSDLIRYYTDFFEEES